jgi:hypothetical protein
MNDKDYELLSQYLDGELGASQVLFLERRLAADPQLQATLEQLQELNSTLQEAFDVPGTDAVPQQVTRMLQKPLSNVVAFPVQRRAGVGFAIAASLLAATGLLFFEASQPGSNNPLQADALLAQTLEHSPSRAEGWNQLSDGRQVQPMLSFYSKSNGWCREYRLADQGQQLRGVACRGEEHWVNAVITAEQAGIPGASNDYRPAGADDVSPIQHFVDTQAQDIPLSARAEAELIANSWQ